MSKNGGQVKAPRSGAFVLVEVYMLSKEPIDSCKKYPANGMPGVDVAFVVPFILGIVP